MRMEKTIGDIWAVSRKAIILAKQHNTQVFFIFNDTEICANPESYAGDLALIYQLKREVRQPDGCAVYPR